MKVLAFGDIFGRGGRRALKAALPGLIEQFHPDFIIANTENLTHGKGPSIDHLDSLTASGVDIFMGGNHLFTKKDEIFEYLDRPNSPQLRPANHFSSSYFSYPGSGYRIFTKGDKRLLAINLMSGVFLKDQMDNPFLVVDRILSEQAGKYDACVIDFHRETTAELVCMAEWVKGRVSLIYGTHTHVQTNDERIIEGGTAMMTDIGMTGPIHSAIGQDFESRIAGFVSGSGIFAIKPVPMEHGPMVVTGVFVETGDSGRAIHIEKIRITSDE